MRPLRYVIQKFIIEILEWYFIWPFLIYVWNSFAQNYPKKELTTLLELLDVGLSESYVIQSFGGPKVVAIAELLLHLIMLFVNNRALDRVWSVLRDGTSARQVCYGGRLPKWLCKEVVTSIFWLAGLLSKRYSPRVVYTLSEKTF